VIVFVCASLMLFLFSMVLYINDRLEDFSEYVSDRSFCFHKRIRKIERRLNDLQEIDNMFTKEPLA